MTKSESMLDLRAAARTPPAVRRGRRLSRLDELEDGDNENDHDGMIYDHSPLDISIRL